MTNEQIVGLNTCFSRIDKNQKAIMLALVAMCKHITAREEVEGIIFKRLNELQEEDNTL